MISRFIQFASPLCMLLSIAAAARAQTAPSSRPTVPLEMVKLGNRMLARHTGTYQPLALHWDLNAGVHGIIAVYPHPLASSQILLATDAGLLLSNDAGQTFTPLPQGTVDRIGTVTSIAFAPDEAATFYIATAGHGLWISKDGGQTIAQLATKETGLASDIVRTVLVAPDDPMHRTIIALHGDDAPGASQSSDGGRTWHTLFPDQHILQLFWISPNNKEVLAEAAAVATPDARMVYYMPSLQEPWQKLLSDVTVTGAASPQRDRDGTIILATAERGFFRITREGGAVINVGPTDEADWASFGVVHSPTADQQLFYAYQPKHLGLVLFTNDQLKGAPAADADPPTTAPAGLPPGEPPGPQYATASDGLFTGPLVMDGAHIRANASGTIFFAAVNKQLYRGVAAGPDLNIANVTVTPPVLLVNINRLRQYQSTVGDDLTAIAASHNIAAVATGTLGAQLNTDLKALDIQRYTISATIQAPNPPAAVTVDLSRLGLSARSPLFDDGQHNDGAAGDGVWANQFSVDFSTVDRNNEDWRSGAPGPVPLTVTAISDHQTLAGAVGLLALYTRQTAIPFLVNSKPVRLDGNVSGSITGAYKPHKSVQTIVVKGPGSWSVVMRGGRTVADISGQGVLAFYIRSPQETDSEINIQLGDQPTYSRPTQTPPLPLLAGGFIANHKITRTDQRVVIPISRLLEGATGFQPSLTANLFLSGNATAPFDLIIHDLRFLPSEDASSDDAGEKQ